MRRLIITAMAIAGCALGGAAASATQRGSAADREFISQMAIAGITEVHLGRLALKQAASNDVKAFGQMMVDEHTQANDELAKITKQMGMTPAAQVDKTHKLLIDKLTKLSGASFDRDYLAEMVKGHQEVADALRKRAGEQPDTMLSQWAALTLPAVEHHLQRAQELQGAIK